MRQVDFFSLPGAGQSAAPPGDELPYFSLSPGNGLSGPAMLISRISAGNMGPSHEFENEYRLRLLKALSADPRRVAALRQEHTKTVYTAAEVLHGSGTKPADSAGPRPAQKRSIGDGLVTDNPRHLLCVTVADCLPIFLVHPAGRIFGLVHSGWKGTGIALDAARLMVRHYNIRMEDLRVIIGPGIGPCCYTVDEKRAEYFRRNFGEDTVSRQAGDADTPGSGGTKGAGPVYHLDLKQANINSLTEAGIGSIAVCRDCTSCSPDLGSFRRQGAGGFTRMIALIGYL